MPVYDPANPAYDPMTQTFRNGRLFPEDLMNFRADLLAHIAAGTGTLPAGGVALLGADGARLTGPADGAPLTSPTGA